MVYTGFTLFQFIICYIINNQLLNKMVGLQKKQLYFIKKTGIYAVPAVGEEQNPSGSWRAGFVS